MTRGRVQGTAPHGPWAATAVVCLGLFLLGMDLTVLNVAVPGLQSQLSASITEIHWIVDGYALVLGGTVLASGSATDRMGRRRAFTCGLAVCAAASVLGGLAQTPWQVIASRCGMGAGAALLMPATLSLISNLFPEPRLRRRAIAAWTAVAGAGGLTGPVIGGLLVEHFSWRAAFWLNLPLAALTIALAFLLVPESRAPQTEKTDVRGACLSAVGLLTLVWAIIEGPARGWTSRPVLGAFALAGLLLALFALQQRHCPHPMLPLRLLRDARVPMGAVALALTSFALFGTLFVLTLYLQGVLGHTPWEAGVRTLPLPAALAAGAGAGQFLTGTKGEKATIVLGLGLLTAAFLFLTSTEPGSDYAHLVVFQVAAGVGAGMVALAGTVAVMDAMPAARAGLGSAVNDATRQVGSALGVAVQGSLLATVYTDRFRDSLVGVGLPARLREAGQDNVLAAAALAPRVPPVQRARLTAAVEDAFVSGMTCTAFVSAGVMLGTAAAVCRWFPGRVSARPADRPADSARTLGAPALRR
ncbi:MFS transporter [Streptomyces aureocirculatus]|uniref:MFS transporter n=1 Tax=Streptomyces aureocirculatus TaxID=67275 RepID=UPI000689D0BD|nr:MFS transporter [Streptomyces aureocirculatus]